METESGLELLVRPRVEDMYLRVLVAEEDPELRALLAATLSQFGFGCQEASNAIDALAILRDAAAERSDTSAMPRPGSDRSGSDAYASLVCEFGLVICDVRMPDGDGFSFLDEVLASYPDVSVIMLTGVDRSRVAVECLQRGATDYLVKPVDMDDLIVAVHHALERRRLLLQNRLYQTKLERMVQARTHELRQTLGRLQQTYSETLAALATALDAREQETAHHSERVARDCQRLLQCLSVEDDESLTVTGQGALLHDIGKIGIPDSILLKPGPLDDAEWRVMRQHPSIGHEILRGIEFLEPSLELVLHHQEKFDGSGYPMGLAGNEIPLSARAFAVVDAWDAMTHARPYRQPMSAGKATAELIRCAGSHFDPQVVDTFLEMKRTEGVLSI